MHFNNHARGLLCTHPSDDSLRSSTVDNREPLKVWAQEHDLHGLKKVLVAAV